MTNERRLELSKLMRESDEKSVSGGRNDGFFDARGKAEMKLERPAPLPVRETTYGFLSVTTADVYSDGRRENVKKTPFWRLFDDDERQTDCGSQYRRTYKVNHKPM